MRRFFALFAVVLIVSCAVSPTAWAAPRSVGPGFGFLFGFMERIGVWVEATFQKVGGHMDPNGLDRARELAEPPRPLSES